jgi:hypothetical protein
MWNGFSVFQPGKRDQKNPEKQLPQIPPVIAFIMLNKSITVFAVFENVDASLVEPNFLGISFKPDQPESLLTHEKQPGQFRTPFIQNASGANTRSDC